MDVKMHVTDMYSTVLIFIGPRISCLRSYFKRRKPETPQISSKSDPYMRKSSSMIILYGLFGLCLL